LYRLAGLSSLGRRDGKIHIPHLAPFCLYLPKLGKQKGGILAQGKETPLQKNAQKGGYPAAFLCVVVFGQTL
jgi:hypothetical protein